MNLDQDAAPGGRAENYYEVLGLAPGATDEEIEAAYADLSSMFAPGKVPASRQEYARRQRSRLAAAYAVLADPDQRASYDRRLGVLAPPAAPALPAELQAEEQQIAGAPGAATDVDAADRPGPAPTADVPVAAALEAPVTPAAPPVEPVAEPAPGPAVLPWEAPAATLEQTTPLPEATTVIAPAAPAAAAEPEAEEAEGAEEPWDEDDDEVVAEEPWEDEDEAAEEPWEDEDEGELSEDDIPPPAPVRPARPGQPAAARVAPTPARGTAPPPAPVRGPAPGGARPATGVRVEPARPAAKGSSAAVPPPRTGGVALPSRREAAQITARQQAAPPPPPVAAPRVARRPTAPVARRYDYEEEEAPRYRQARQAPPPRRRRRNNNRLAYQIMTLVLGLVLVASTVASVVMGISSSGATGTTTSQTDTATLIAQGNAALQQNNPAAALGYFQQVYSAAPTNLDALLGLAEAYAQRNGPGDTAQAQNYASQVIRQGQNSAQAQQAIQILAALSNTPAAGSPAATTPTEAPAGSPPAGAPAKTP